MNELQKKLEEAGVKYTYRILGCKTYINWGEPMVNGAQFIDGGDWTELTVENATPEQAIAATLGNEREKRLEKLVDQLWYLVNHRSGYGYAAALEAIEELGIEVNE